MQLSLGDRVYSMQPLFRNGDIHFHIQWLLPGVSSIVDAGAFFIKALPVLFVISEHQQRVVGSRVVILLYLAAHFYI